MKHETLWVHVAQELGLISEDQGGAILVEWNGDPAISIEQRLRDILDEKEMSELEVQVLQFSEDFGDNADSTIESPGGARILKGVTTSSSPSSEEAKEVVDDFVSREELGRYVVEGELGRGTFGMVHVAYDQHVGRSVAVKELIRGSQNDSGSPTSRYQRVLTTRFLREARITGQLQHPSIVPVYEIGRRPTGELYYTMKQVKGQTLSEKIREVKSLEEALRLLPHYWDLCNATAFAHSKNVIHRDIKPNNVMIGEFGETVVLDWGLAKVRGEKDDHAEDLERGVLLLKNAKAEMTTMGSTIGTPAYMSPEQARGNIEAIDELSDIYSLGAVLYEILCGHTPYRGTSAADMLVKVLNESIEPLEDEPRPPPPELAAIAVKALSKKREERYASARELASDVEAYMSGEKVAVYTYSSTELMKRFASKNKVALIASVFVLFALVGSLISSSMSLSKEKASNKQMKVAVKLERHAKQQAFFNMAQGFEREAGLLMAQNRLAGAKIYAASSLVHNPANPQSPYFHSGFARNNPLSLNVRAGAASRIYEAEHEDSLVLDRVIPTEDANYSFAISPDEQLIAVGGADSKTTFWNMNTWKPVSDFVGHDSRVYTIEFSPDGNTIISGSTDGTVRAFNVESKKQLWRYDFPGSRIFDVVVSPDGKWVITCGDGNAALLLDAQTGRVVREFSGHVDWIHGLAISPDGKTIATASYDNAVNLWEVETGNRLAMLNGHKNQVLSASFSHDGRLLATGGFEGVIRVWDVDTHESLDVLEGPSVRVFSVSFSADDKLLISSASDRYVRLWDMETRKNISTVQAHMNSAYDARFLGSSNRIVSVSLDETLKVWKIEQASSISSLKGHERSVWSVKYSNDGKRVVSTSVDETVRVWDAQSNDLLGAFKGHKGTIYSAEFSPDDKMIASGGADKKIIVWDANTFESLFELSGHTEFISSVVFSKDGSKLASCANDKTIRLWDIAGKKELRVFSGHEDRVNNVVFAKGDSLLITISSDNTIRLWDVESGEQIRSAKTPDWLTGLEITNDEKWIFTSGKDKRIVMWELATLKKVREFVGHKQWVNFVTVSSNGRYIASSSDDNTVRLWSVSNAEPLLILQGTQFIGLDFSPDGRSLAVADNNEIRLFPMELSNLDKDPQKLQGDFERASGLILKGFVLENMDPSDFARLSATP